MKTTRDRVVGSLQRSLGKLLAFRGLDEPDEGIGESSNPVVDLGLKSSDLVNVGPDLEQESEELNVPNEVLDWADDSSGTRRYRTVGEIADRIMEYIGELEAGRRE